MTNTQPEAEDMPGYDGPTLDAADRLHMWMDKSVPAADRNRLIAEHRDEVLAEGAGAQFAVVFDRPDANLVRAWGPFPDARQAGWFAEFVTDEIDPACVTPWAEAVATPGIRVLAPVAELLAWRKSVALPQLATPTTREG